METSKDENNIPEGELLKVIHYPSPILKKVAKPVKTFDKDLKKFCQDMLYTMYQAPGIGLAAPQVGKSLRIFVLDIDYEREKITKADGKTEYKLKNLNPLIFINPVIKDKEGEMNYEEGCLSLPGLYEEVKWFENIVVEYQDLEGNLQKMTGTDLLSVCIQHENDHLDGIIFLERLSFIKRNFLTKKYLKGQKRSKPTPNIKP
ncbi:MAG: peptide deformylase [Bdellovibrionota bacterium]|nr:peptide deformylase [Bdellovibrionota bacterium]